MCQDQSLLRSAEPDGFAIVPYFQGTQDPESHWQTVRLTSQGGKRRTVLGQQAERRGHRALPAHSVP
jgi:hypothetical protein